MPHSKTPHAPHEIDDEFTRLLKAENEAYKALECEPVSQAYRRNQDDMLEALKAIGEQGDSEEILGSEKMFVMQERDLFPRTKPEITSYNRVLEQLTSTEALFSLVRDHKKYSMIAQAFGKRGCIHGVPKDAARWFFKDHHKWLARKFLRPRMTKTEVAMIETRQENLRMAEVAYDALQRQALGLLHT